jgi:predicted RNA-binding Zn ribbon-like protein
MTVISRVRDALSLEYANSLSWRGSTAPTERLHDIADLLGWIERSAGVPTRALRHIRTWAREHPAKAVNLFDEAIETRETIYRIFSALADGAAVSGQDFAALRDAIVEAPARKELVRSDGHYAWRIDDLAPSVAHLLAPVLWSAGDLMLNLGHRRVRRCVNEKCLWLFLDESKSGTRRWCDMASCGNRVKARRHYLKLRGLTHR